MQEFLVHRSSLILCVCLVPQEVALATMRKEVDFCRKMNLEVMGVVENMSGYQCPCCQVWGTISSSVSFLSLHTTLVCLMARITSTVGLGNRDRHGIFSQNFAQKRGVCQFV